MKSPGIMYILFLIFTFSGYAGSEENKTAQLLYRKKISDSLYLSKSRTQLAEHDAQAIIQSFGDHPENEKNLDNNDLKALSVSYAAINEPVQATNYLEKYIKNSHDFEILNSDYLSRIKNSPEFESISKKYKPQFSFWFLLYLYTALVGIFVSVILNFRKESDRLANLFICLFIFFSSLFVIHIGLFISNIQYLYPHTIFFTITFNFLYGPLLYLYFKRITEKYKFKSMDLLHFVPAVFFLIYFSKYYFLPAGEKLHILLNQKETFDPMIYVLVALKVISLLVYAILIYRIYNKSSNTNLGVEKFILNWQRNLVVLNFAYVLAHLLYLTLVLGLLPLESLIHPQILLMALLILYIGITAYLQPQIFNRKYIFNENIKYQKSGLTEEYSIELKEQLLKLLYSDKVYKESNISLDILSDRLGTTRHSASQVINEHFKMNFFNLINKFRIEEAQKILKDDLYSNNLSIIDVAYDVGFNNKVTFNKAFKECTELTPTQYIKSLKSENTRNLNVNLG